MFLMKTTLILKRNICHKNRTLTFAMAMVSKAFRVLKCNYLIAKGATLGYKDGSLTFAMLR